MSAPFEGVTSSKCLIILYDVATVPYGSTTSSSDGIHCSPHSQCCPDNHLRAYCNIHRALHYATVPATTTLTAPTSTITLPRVVLTISTSDYVHLNACDAERHCESWRIKSTAARLSGARRSAYHLCAASLMPKRYSCSKHVDSCHQVLSGSVDVLPGRSQSLIPQVKHC